MVGVVRLRSVLAAARGRDEEQGQGAGEAQRRWLNMRGQRIEPVSNGKRSGGHGSLPRARWSKGKVSRQRALSAARSSDYPFNPSICNR
jgi:hypothetical protein